MIAACRIRSGELNPALTKKERMHGAAYNERQVTHQCSIEQSRPCVHLSLHNFSKSHQDGGLEGGGPIITEQEEADGLGTPGGYCGGGRATKRCLSGLRFHGGIEFFDTTNMREAGFLMTQAAWEALAAAAEAAGLQLRKLDNKGEKALVQESRAALREQL